MTDSIPTVDGDAHAGPGLRAWEPGDLTEEDLTEKDPLDRNLWRRRRRRPHNVRTGEPRRWVDALFEPGDVIEFRFTPPKSVTEPRRPRQLMTLRTAKYHGLYPWAFADEVEVVVNSLAALNGGATTWWGRRDGGRWVNEAPDTGVPVNVYASANPRLTTGGRKADDVLLARSVFVDMDKTTVQEAVAKVHSAGLPPPTVTVDSGHGAHFFWRLLEPVTDLGEWSALQKRLIRLLESDPTIHDPPRIMRLPGFLNVNGNRPVPCSIHDADPGRRYALTDITRHLPPALPEPDGPRKSPGSGGPKKSGRVPLPVTGDTLSVRGVDRRTLGRAKLYAARFEPVEDNRNSTAFARTCALVEKFDLGVREVLPLIEQVNAGADDPLDAGEVEEVVGKAVEHVRRKSKPRGPAAGPVRHEKYQEPTGPDVALDDWRRQMTDARLDSLKHTGKVFFDGSPAGAGKSTADLAAMKLAGKSATFLPTHDACDELVKKLADEGLSAAAHPPFDDSTCLKFGTKSDPGPARLALHAGLNVGRCVCTSCDMRGVCEYQKRRELARTADHAVATHARASLSDFRPAEGRPVVFVHEDAVGLLRPVVKLAGRSADVSTPERRHLEDVVRVATAAEGVARSWQDHKAITLAGQLRDATNEVIALLDAPDLVKPLEDAAANGRPTEGLPTVKPLPLRPHTPHAVQIDYLLRRAMDVTGVRTNGPDLKLALGYCLGELSELCAVVDETKTKGGRPCFSQSLVGVWKVDMPKGAVVWLEDASATAASVTELVGREVVDRTPPGRLGYHMPPVQYAGADVTQRTCGNKVRGVVRGLLARYPRAVKVGIITHQCHVADVEALDPVWRRRIGRVEYFRSGKDRASNSWLGCDLILVVGTPRVPPAAVRDLLIRLGRAGEAARPRRVRGGDLGRTHDGCPEIVDGCGYSDPSWAGVQDHLVRETLRQAVGRGRGVTDHGVPVVVVSNEALGLPLADHPLTLVSDAEDETLRLAVSAAARNAKHTSLADRAAAHFVTGDVSGVSRNEARAVRKHLASLSFSGLLKKKGERSGWVLAAWLLSKTPTQDQAPVE